MQNVLDFLRWFVLVLFLLVVLVVVGSLLGREVVAFNTTGQLKNELRTAKALGNDREACPVISSQMGGMYAQLRVVDEQSYAVEVICEGFNSKPVLKSEGKLPTWVRWDSASTGVVFKPSAQLSLVKLQFALPFLQPFIDRAPTIAEPLRKVVVIGVKDTSVVAEPATEETDLGVGPE